MIGWHPPNTHSYELYEFIEVLGLDIYKGLFSLSQQKVLKEHVGHSAVFNSFLCKYFGHPLCLRSMKRNLPSPFLSWINSLLYLRLYSFSYRKSSYCLSVRPTGRFLGLWPHSVWRAEDNRGRGHLPPKMIKWQVSTNTGPHWWAWECRQWDARGAAGGHISRASAWAPHWHRMHTYQDSCHRKVLPGKMFSNSLTLQSQVWDWIYL